jgi:hypothetical protein
MLMLPAEPDQGGALFEEEVVADGLGRAGFGRTAAIDDVKDGNAAGTGSRRRIGPPGFTTPAP